MALRRYLRFRLKTLLIVFTVFVLWLGYTANRAHRQKVAVRHVVEARGWLWYTHQEPDFQGDRIPRATVGLSHFNLFAPAPGPTWLRELIGEDFFVSPVTVTFPKNAPVSSESLARLTDLPSLENIHLHQSSLSDDLLHHLPRLKQLRELHIEPSIRGEENKRVQNFAFLRRFPNLLEVSLSFSAIQDQDVAFLNSASKLQKLDLSWTRFGDAGLLNLKTREVVWLNLAGTEITDTGLSNLSSISKLVHLNLSSTDISDAGVSKIRSLPELAYLNLSYTHVTDEAVDDLMRMPKLTSLKLVETSISDDGANRIHDALPRCSISFGDNKRIRSKIRE